MGIIISKKRRKEKLGLLMSQRSLILYAHFDKDSNWKNECPTKNINAYYTSRAEKIITHFNVQTKHLDNVK